MPEAPAATETPSRPEVPASGRRARKVARAEARKTSAWLPRWFWPSFTFPGLLWLLVMFILPFYAVVSVAFGSIDRFRNPLPVWQPWYWTTKYTGEVFQKFFGENAYLQPTFIRTLIYVGIASSILLVAGYAVAYYVARHAGKRKTLILVLLISPFWISYLMRMLAWVNLLESDGYVNRTLQLLHVTDQPIAWLQGKPITVILGLVYGYMPYMILPLFGFLDRIQPSLLEAGRDLGGSPTSTFVRVTLPLSKPAILAGLVIVSLPMFGDYYTQNLLSASPKTNMYGNLIDEAVGASGQGPQGAVLVLILMVMLLVPMMYYLRSTLRAQEGR